TLNSVLLFYFLLGFGFGPLIAAFGALLYGVHPLQVEVVAWISAQKDLLSSFWILVTLNYFQRVFLPEDSLNFKKYLTLSGFVLMAILSKSTAVILAPVIFFWWAFIKKRDWFTSAIQLFFPLLFSIIFAIVTAGQQPASALPFKANIFERLWVSLDTITFYLIKLFWPINLTVEYGRNPPYFLSSPDRYWTWIPAVCLIFICIHHWRRFRDEVKLGLAIIGAGLLPVLGIKSFVYQNVSTVSDRYMSVPLIGVTLVFCVAVNYILNLRAHKIVATYAACALIVTACALTSFNITPHWRNVDSLWARVIQVNPRSWFAYNNWAAHFELKGERLKAIEYYEKSLGLRPDSMVYTRVGILYYDENQLGKAHNAFKEAVRLDPMNAIARQNLNVQ
ncbi:MAG: tetratricopeptide repeat protein, partial [Bdellovibrionales bacterium]|nr:tetratricopeptide repeat protein [Bdellovibrionales bacterium]